METSWPLDSSAGPPHRRSRKTGAQEGEQAQGHSKRVLFLVLFFVFFYSSPPFSSLFFSTFSFLFFYLHLILSLFSNDSASFSCSFFSLSLYLPPLVSHSIFLPFSLSLFLEKSGNCSFSQKEKNKNKERRMGNNRIEEK